MVMRVTLSEGSRSVAILALQGSVSREWATLLERECSDLLRTSRTVRLDMSAVTFVDQMGLEVLDQLSRAGVEILGPTGAVASVIEGEGIPFSRGTSGANGEEA